MGVIECANKQITRGAALGGTAAAHVRRAMHAALCMPRCHQRYQLRCGGGRGPHCYRMLQHCRCRHKLSATAGVAGESGSAQLRRGYFPQAVCSADEMILTCGTTECRHRGCREPHTCTADGHKACGGCSQVHCSKRRGKLHHRLLCSRSLPAHTLFASMNQESHPPST